MAYQINDHHIVDDNCDTNYLLSHLAHHLFSIYTRRQKEEKKKESRKQKVEII